MAPRTRRQPAGQNGFRDPLQVELLQEKAANLGRLGRRLERALTALRTWDAEGGPAADEHRHSRREELLTEAGDALFLYVVQREVTGLGGTPAVLDQLGVPRDVRLRTAPRSCQKPRPRPASG